VTLQLFKWLSLSLQYIHITLARVTTKRYWVSQVSKKGLTSSKKGVEICMCVCTACLLQKKTTTWGLFFIGYRPDWVKFSSLNHSWTEPKAVLYHWVELINSFLEILWCGDRNKLVWKLKKPLISENPKITFVPPTPQPSRVPIIPNVPGSPESYSGSYTSTEQLIISNPEEVSPRRRPTKAEAAKKKGGWM